MELGAPADRWRSFFGVPRVADGRSASTWRLIAAATLLALFLAWAPLKYAAVGSLGAIIVLASLLAPAAALTVLALAIPFGSLVPLPMPGVNVVDALVGLVVIVWLCRGLAARRLDIHIPALTWPMLVLVWVLGLSLTQAASWRLGLSEWLKWLEFAALFLVAVQIFQDTADGRRERRLAWVLAGLFAGGIIEVGLGAYQFWYQAGPKEFILMGRFMRAYGTFQQPNPYAGYLGYLAPVALSLCLAYLVRWWRERQRRDLWLTLATGGTGVLLVAGIGMSWSRGGWFGLAGALLAVLLLQNRRAASVALVGSLAIGVLVLLIGTSWLPTSIARRLSDLDIADVNVDIAHVEVTDDNFAVLERLGHWQAGLDMFFDHPWLGVGVGNYATAYPAYARPHFYDALGHAHNVYINFLAESGVAGGAAFLAFWGAALASTWCLARRTRDGFDALAVGALGALAYVTVHNVFDDLFVAHIQLQLALLLAMVCTAWARCSKSSSSPVRQVQTADGEVVSIPEIRQP